MQVKVTGVLFPETSWLCLFSLHWKDPFYSVLNVGQAFSNQTLIFVS